MTLTRRVSNFGMDVVYLFLQSLYVRYEITKYNMTFLLSLPDYPYMATTY